MSGLLTAVVIAALSSHSEVGSERKATFTQPVEVLKEHSTSAAPVMAFQPAIPLIENIARQVTVRILNGDSAGSGVLIGRQDGVFSVLTCDHVVDKVDRQYQVLTFDGIAYPGVVRRFTKLGSIDLAIVQFRSTRSYSVAEIAKNRPLSEGKAVYAAGYPNYHSPNASLTESTYDWGTKAFVFTTGKVGMVSKKSLPGGYNLGYTNKIAGGMSGGPILNQKGQLIGINGRLQYPLQGIKAYTFTDGTRPSQTLFEKMEALSWGILVNDFPKLLGLLQ